MLVENFFFKPEILAGMKDNDQIHHDTNTNTSNRLEALLEAAGLSYKKNSLCIANENLSNTTLSAHENVPVIRNATIALDEAAQALNRMRNESGPRDRR